MHILEGFATVFDALDAILEIVREIGGQTGCRRENNGAVQARRRADRRHPRAQIYRLARLEILVIQKELAEKRKRAKEIANCSRKKNPSVSGASFVVRSKRS